MKPVEAKWELNCTCPACGEAMELVSWFEHNYEDSSELFLEEYYQTATEDEPMTTECPHCERNFTFQMQR